MKNFIFVVYTASDQHASATIGGALRQWRDSGDNSEVLGVGREVTTTTRGYLGGPARRPRAE